MLVCPSTTQLQLLIPYLRRPTKISALTNLQDVSKEIEEIHKAMGGRVDVSFDCVGYDKTMTTALHATRPGGKVCLVGMGHSEMTVPLTGASARYDFLSQYCMKGEKYM